MFLRSRHPAGTLAGLALLVTVVHLWLAGHVLDSQLGEGGADRVVRRIEVAFVRELQQQQPPAGVIAAPPPVPRAARAIAPPAVAASAPLSSPVIEPVAAVPALEIARPTPEPAPPIAEAQRPAPAASNEAAETVASTPVAAPVPPAASGAPPAAVAFEWPPSTRLSYQLTGDYRGPVDGRAQVQWVRSGSRYQVHLDVVIGPSFAPIVTRRMTSDGDITPDGLRPRRYDEETRVAFRSPRAQTIVFDDALVRLPGGQALPLPQGVQDAASQFVQMTWMFTVDPTRLEVGRSVELPLALPRRVEPWTYDIIGREMLPTPAGNVQTLHLKPRRDPRPGGDLSAEMWVAPSLQYLPVRIVIRQDRDTYVDMVIERLPQQAADAPAPR
ncbi:MAG: DUF3108 domain-containing protein [Rubrivivax sp.]|nr:DUF3108 domain-containing protein [Rubrivivax sp.]